MGPFQTKKSVKDLVRQFEGQTQETTQKTAQVKAAYSPMDMDQTQQFIEERVGMQQRFVAEFSRRQKKSSYALHKAEEEVTIIGSNVLVDDEPQLEEITVEKKARVMERPVEPELSEKDRKQKLKQDEKNLKKGMKLSPYATASTVTILESEKQRMKAGEDAGSGMGEEEMKQHVLSMEFNAYEFSAEYMGRHFRDVQKKMEDLKLFIATYVADNEKFKTLDNGEAIRARSLAAFYDKLRAAYVSGLAANGLMDMNGVLTPISLRKNMPSFKEANNVFVENLKKEILDTESDEEVRLEAEAKKLSDEAQADAMQEYNVDERWAEFKEKAPYLPFKMINEYDYKTLISLHDMMGAPQNMERCAANKEAIDVIHAEVLKLYQAYTEVCRERNNADCAAGKQEQLDRQKGRQISALTQTLRWRADGFGDQGNELMNHIILHVEALEHLIEGKKIQDAAALLMSEKFGLDLGGIEEKKKALFAATRYYKETNEFKKEKLRSILMEREKKKILLEHQGQQSGEMSEELLKQLAAERTEKLMQNGQERKMMLIGDSDAHNESVVDLILLEIRDRELNDRCRDLRGKEGKEEELKEAETQMQGNKAELEKVVEAHVEPVIQKNLAFDPSRFEGMSPAELALHVKELVDLNISGQMVTDLGKLITSDGVPMKAKLLEKWRQESGAAAGISEDGVKKYFAMKCAYVQGYFMMARSAAIFEAQKFGDLDFKEVLTFKEYSDKGKEYASGSETTKAVLFARNLYRKGLQQVNMAKMMEKQFQKNGQEGRAE